MVYLGGPRLELIFLLTLISYSPFEHLLDPMAFQANEGESRSVCV